MNKRDLSFNPDTAVKVLRYILNNKNVSIAEIVDDCAVSRLTAARVVEFFLDKSLLIRGLQKEKVRSGMRPERYRMNPKYNCIVYSLSDTCFRANLVNADGKAVHSEVYSDNDRALTEEDFARFVRDFNDKYGDYREEYRFGSAVIFSGRKFFGMEITCTEALESVRERLVDTVKSQTNVKRAAAGTREEFAAQYFANSRLFSDKTVIYLCLNYDRLYSAAIVNGQRILGANGRGFDAYEVRFDRIRAAEHIMQNRKAPDELADALALICANARAFYDPHFIYLDTEDYRHMDGLSEIVGTFLSEKYALSGTELPVIDFTSRKGLPVAHLGACNLMRNLLINDIGEKLAEMT